MRATSLQTKYKPAASNAIYWYCEGYDVHFSTILKVHVKDDCCFWGCTHDYTVLYCVTYKWYLQPNFDYQYQWFFWGKV